MIMEQLYKPNNIEITMKERWQQRCKERWYKGCPQIRSLSCKRRQRCARVVLGSLDEDNDNHGGAKLSPLLSSWLHLRLVFISGLSNSQRGLHSCRSNQILAVRWRVGFRDRRPLFCGRQTWHRSHTPVTTDALLHTPHATWQISK